MHKATFPVLLIFEEMLLRCLNFRRSFTKKIQGRIRDVVIRFQHEDKSIAISSDTLPEVMAIEKENLKDAEDYLDSLELEYISKVFDIKEGMVMILNIPNLWLVK